MIETERQIRAPADRAVYPSLNIYFSPRVVQQRVDQRSIPMCVYTRAVQATNMSRIYDKNIPDSSNLRELEMKDGLIYQFNCMNKVERENIPRLKIKVMICVCMYNESRNAIDLTLNGIYENLAQLQEEGICSQEVAVVLMQDGILKLVSDRAKRKYAKGSNSMVQFYRDLDQLDGKKKCDLEERINAILDEMENYNRRGMGGYLADNRDFPSSIQKNISLLYQNLWHPGMTDKKKLQDTHYTNYLKIFSCFKHLNGTKLSSHLWFFEGFCRYLDPQFIVLLDVGTKPEKGGIANLLRGFSDPNVGGVTGLMSIDSSFQSEQGGADQEDQENAFTKCLRNNFFSIQKAQQYEYIISHFLDKNAEGALGYLHVLPGAWSAYRYRALIKSQQYEPNLLEHSYFKMILNPELQQKDYREANMYLAEDRILSLGIYCQINQKYYLKYIPNAIAKTDPMKDHENLMKQRRRWVNSSLFAFLYVWKNYQFNSEESNHSFFDKYIKLNLVMVLALLSFVTSYFTPAIYFYVLYTTIYQINTSAMYVSIIASVCSIIYVIVFIISVAGGLMGTVWTKHAHSISAILAVYNYCLFGLVAYNILAVYLDLAGNGINFTDFSQMSILVMTLTNIGCYFIVVFMHIFTHPQYVLKLILDFVSYLSYQGAYSQTIVSYSFCNVDDVSWGTKGTSTQSGQKYDSQKILFVSSWLFYNCILAFIFVYIDIVIPNSSNEGASGNRRIILICIGFYGTAQMLTKSLLAFYHHLKWIFTDCQVCRSTPIWPGRIDKVNYCWDKLKVEYQSVINIS